MSDFSTTRRSLGISGGVDKTGLASITLNFLAVTDAEMFTVGYTSFMGLPAQSRSFRNMENGEVIVAVTYEGFPEGTDPSDQGEDSEDWGVDFDFKEEPIESHHSFQKIKQVYGGVVTDGKVEFPELLPKAVSSRSGLGGVARKANTPNPLFGQETFPLRQARVTRTFSSKEIPANIASRVGSVLKNIPGAPRDIAKIDWGKRRNWLWLEPKIKNHGNAWKFTESWLLSPVGGWPPEVHSIIE